MLVRYAKISLVGSRASSSALYRFLYSRRRVQRASSLVSIRAALVVSLNTWHATLASYTVVYNM